MDEQRRAKGSRTEHPEDAGGPNDGKGGKDGGGRRSQAEPTLEVEPKRPAEGAIVHLRGEGWPNCAVRISVDKRAQAIARVATGADTSDGILPGADGSFAVSLLTIGWSAGRHTIVAESTHKSGALARVQVSVLARPLAEIGGEGDRPRARALEFFRRRFGPLGAVPPGLRQHQVAQVRELRSRARVGRQDRQLDLRDRVLGLPGRDVALPEPGDLRMPVIGACNWTPVGPAGIVVGPGNVWSGRTLSIAFANPPSTIFVGTAGGGVWRSTDSGQNWSPRSDYQSSLAVGAVAVDPNQPLHVLAGTGEYDNYYIGTYFGNGILRSDDGGDTWVEVAASTFQRDEISRIVFDPTDSTGQRVALSSSIGVFDSTDGGTNWTLARAGSASDLVLFRPNGPLNRVTAIAAFEGSGLWTATRSAGSSWGAWSQLTGAAFPVTFDRITLGQQRSDPKVIYALFGNGWNVAGMARTLDGSTWTKVDIRLNSPCGGRTDSSPGHFHDVTIPAADLTAAPVAHTYTTSAASGGPAHTHSMAFTAAQITAIAAGASVSATTPADATGHQHTADFAITGQLGYNMCAAVHPTDADTAFLGERNLWKTTTGGGVFNPLPILHTDEHALAFEPGSPSVLWMASDGGVFHSSDAGNSWEDRNRDLATLEYIGLAQNPTWETVLLGGTQDNGTHRYSGSPAWRLVDGGDGGFAAIDPVVPTRMYHEYVGSAFYSSDDAGTSWTDANQGVGAGPFYSPFAIDPTNHNVCYFGGFELWRRDFSVAGSTWSAVTSGMGGGSTGVAVDPSDATKVYVSTDNGSVWRVQRTGATWGLADVTRTDMSAGLPRQSLSDVIVDSAGTIWASVSSVYASESFGEFSSDHVFRRAAADTMFLSRSNGLAQGNPINSIVVDPSSNSRLFAGCDVGVFRTDDAGLNWVPWDEGIPNAPVFKLVVHRPRRLLRAATHGRSVWERPIDALSCPLVDLYVRDDLVDSGRVQPTPSGVADPLSTTGVLTHWWQSPDVKVDAPEPTFQTATPIGDYVSFEASIVHRTALRNRTNRFYVQVHNRGIARTTNVQVRAFFATASAGLPALPADFWSAGKPFTGTPSGTTWTAIGPTQLIASLEPAKPAIVGWDWAIPATAAEHSCLLVVTSCSDDPVNGTGILDVGQLVTSRKQVALKNLHILDPVPGGEQPVPMTIRVNNPGTETIVTDVLVHFGNLPSRTRIWAAVDRGEMRGRRSVEETKRTRELLRKSGLTLARSVDDDCGDEREVDMEDMYVATAAKPEVQVLVPGIVVPAGGWRAVTIAVEQPRQIPAVGVQFDVIQRIGDRIVGGSTYRFEPRRRPQVDLHPGRRKRGRGQ
jgi:hypothetical protein